MENKVFYNLDKIISVYVYKKKVNRWFDDFKPKGYYWWKILGIIPLFKYHLEENTFNYVSDRVTEGEVIVLTDNHCYIENEIVYYKPHIHIYFVGDDTSSYFGSSFKKYFENINDLEEFLLYFNNVCKDNNVSLKELNIL